MIPKFRAWLNYKKKMVEISTIDFENEMIDYYNDDGKSCVLLGFNIFKEKDFIMQSTGVKDKNDKEIFEGDIVVIHFSDYQPIKGIVTFINGGFAIKTKIEGTHYLSTWDKEKFEVLGNIYETPTLWKEVN